ncbi:MAG: GxxExxY protein [Weeksellaceae bacterium]
MEEKIFFKEESYKIIGICMNIHSTMGYGFLEAVYCEILEDEFKKNEIPYEREVSLELFYEGKKLKKNTKPILSVLTKSCLKLNQFLF